MGFGAVFVQSRLHLLHRTSHSRYKPLDVFREQRRVKCSKKMAPQTNCTAVFRQQQQQRLLSHVQPPCDHHLSSTPVLRPALNGCTPVCRHAPSGPLSDTDPSCQLTAGYNVCRNLATETVERKLNIADTFDKHSTLRTTFTAQTVDGGCVTCDR